MDYLRRISRSRSRSRSVTPSRTHHSQRPSAARRALLKALVASSGAREPRNDPIPVPAKKLKLQALAVEKTPRGSLKISGDVLDVVQTPRGTIRKTSFFEPPSSEVLEKIEAMDMSDEEAENILSRAPWHVRRWVQDVGNGSEASSLTMPVSPIVLEQEGNIDSISGIAGTQEKVQQPVGSSAGPWTQDPQPSTSNAQILLGESPSSYGVTPAQLNNLAEINAGSDLDSDFDDEFDAPTDPAETIPSCRRVRDIPDDEDLEAPIRNAVNEVQRAMDDEIDRLLGVSSNFIWAVDFDSFRGVPEQFSGPCPGPIKDYDTPYDAFTDIWSKDIMGRIAQETNRYAKQTIDEKRAKGSLKPTSRLLRWQETCINELYVLFGIIMYMGIDMRTSQHEYWIKDHVLEMPKFRKIMPYNRYVLLNSFLHFVDNADPSQYSQQNEGLQLTAKLRKLAPILTHLNSKFSSLYNLQPAISIDESLTLFKGRLSWVQAIRSKAARFGIKSYELCEAKTGYLSRFVIYTGKNSNDVTVPLSADLGGKTTQVVLGLLKGLENRGHCVTMDNFYNSPALARYLKSQGYDCLGTLRPNRKNVPSDISKIPKNVAKGTIVSRHCGDLSIVSWKDTKVVNIISTFHMPDTYEGSKAGKKLVKPICVRDYSQSMGGVDLKDQKLASYLLERKRGLKWYIKIFKRLLNVSIHNAYVLYTSSLKRRNLAVMTHREFRHELANSLMIKHHDDSDEIINEEISVHNRLQKSIVHEPIYELGKQHRKRCYVCYRQGKYKLVHSRCVTCNEFMCFENCWKEWHSLAVLKGQERQSRKRGRRC